MATKNRLANKFYSGWVDLKTNEKVQYKKYFVQLANREILAFDNEIQAKGKGNTTRLKIPLQHVSEISKSKTLPTIILTYRPGVSYREVKIRAENTTEQTKLFRYLQAVALYRVPDDSEALLPGQRQELLDIIKKAKEIESEDEYTDIQGEPHPPNPLFKPVIPVKPPPSALVNVFPPGNQTILSQSPKSPPIPSKPAQYHPHLEKRQQSSPNLTSRSPTSPKGFPPSTLPYMLPVIRDEEPAPPVVPRYAKQSYFIDKELSREDAEDMLSRNERDGNMIIRRRVNQSLSDEWSYAISIKTGDTIQPFKHYRMKEYRGRGKIEFIIYLNDENHPPLYSLDEVVNFVMEKSSHPIRPMNYSNNHYESSIPSQQSERDDFMPLGCYENHDGIDYNNVTGDMRRAMKSSTLPSTGQAHHDAKPPLLPRHTVQVLPLQR